MRKFNFLSFLIGVIAVGGVGAFALTSQYLKSDGTPDFQKLKSTANENRLNAEMRDQLMDGLSKMQAQLPSTHGETIPAGAVMAFNLSSCPDGWSPFTEANDRFIMGSQGNLREKGGNKEIMMQANQLADHSHFFTDIFFSENWYSMGNGIWVNVAWMFSDTRANWIGSKSTDQDNNPVAILRKTWWYVLPSAWSHANSYLYEWYKTRDQNEADKDPQFQRSEKQQPLKILNPYIKLLYCVKGENTAPTPAPSPAPTPRPTPSPAPEIVPAVTYDGKCSKTIPNRCDRGEATDFRAVNSISKDGSHSYRTCKGLNGWKNAFCMHYDPLLRVNDRDGGIR